LRVYRVDGKKKPEMFFFRPPGIYIYVCISFRGKKGGVRATEEKEQQFRKYIVVWKAKKMGTPNARSTMKKPRKKARSTPQRGSTYTG